MLRDVAATARESAVAAAGARADIQPPALAPAGLSAPKGPRKSSAP